MPTLKATMVLNKKKLYMAKNLTELKNTAKTTVSHHVKKNPIKSIKLLKVLNEKWNECFKKSEVDEEYIYVLLFRAMDIWQHLQLTNEYKNDSKYYQMMIGKEISTAFAQLEQLDSSLENRYKTELVTNDTAKKAQPTSNVEDNEILNYLNGSDFKEPVVEKAVEEVSISCKDLVDRIAANEYLLIIDARPPEDFARSRFSKSKVINIPENLIERGLSAWALRERLLDETDKTKFDCRDEYAQIIYVDWNTEVKSLTDDSKFNIFKNILLKWDRNVTYKRKPIILDGGYERYLDTYPNSFTTNSNPKRPEVSASLQFVQLDQIIYPMSDLMDSIVPLNPQTSILSSHLLKPQNKPHIDRTTKPNQVKPTQILDGKENSSESVPMDVSDSENMSEIIPPTPPKLPANTRVINPPTAEEPLPPVGSAEPLSILKSTLMKENGDGDSNISSARIRHDASASPSFSSGLKRSRSSPNIAQLKEDADVPKMDRPTIDRSSKPLNQYKSRPSFTDIGPCSHGEVPRGLTGLKNLGNLCYMNSIMQCVSNTEELKRQLISINEPFKINKNSRTKGQVFDAVKQLIFLLHQGAYRWVSCQELKSVVGQFCNTFAGCGQQDSHEFLTELMDWLHEDLNCPTLNFTLDGASDITGERAWGEFKKKNESIVLELFYGQLRSTITCNECHKQSITFDPFSNLSLPLPMDKERCNLSECIKLYLTGETITGWNCPRCKEPRQAVKKFDITRLPPVLVIHLKRFMTEGVGYGWSRKRSNMVDFPLEDLNMKQYAANSEQRFHTYNLYAVSNHYGTMNSGHYTAFCKNHNFNKWYKFDDQEVTELSPSVVRTPQAYILFYNAITRS